MIVPLIDELFPEFPLLKSPPAPAAEAILEDSSIVVAIGGRLY
jgi:hypothetical protein